MTDRATEDAELRQRIVELESQVSELNEQTVMMSARLAESQNEILDLHNRLQAALVMQNAQSRPETPNRLSLPDAAAQEKSYLSPSPPRSSRRVPSPSRFRNFFRLRDPPHTTNDSTSSTSSSNSTLQEALARETELRKAAEAKLSATNTEIEELTAALFSEANEMVAQERRARAKLEERISVLEKRDAERKTRLERLEKAVTRVDRVRSLVGEERRDSASSLATLNRNDPPEKDDVKEVEVVSA
ncbi:hypothetical protein KEM55_001809 [Ascosphaera atra]|nr:hypothetical protein KEM55_001809 [Ascosphaera atra]